MSGPERLAKALKRAVSKLDVEARLRADAAMRAWPEIVGPLCAAKTRPFLVHEGVMVIKVASSAWANQLNLLKTQYLSAIAERVGSGIITDLRWRVGLGEADPSPPASSAPSSRLEPIPLSNVSLSEADHAIITRQVASIPDPRIADRLTRTLATLTRRQMWLRQQGMIACARCGIFGVAIQDDPQACCPVCRGQAKPASATRDKT